jgi:hypothetical protein
MQTFKRIQLEQCVLLYAAKAGTRIIGGGKVKRGSATSNGALRPPPLAPFLFFFEPFKSHCGCNQRWGMASDVF